MRINQNIAAYNSYRNLNTTSSALSKSLEKLSSGFRINRAADDAAGLVKSESLRAEIGGTNQAISNAQDGVSFVQTAEGALNEVQAILQRVRDLSVSAANTATTDGAAQQAEINQLSSELNAIGSRTTFGGKVVFQDYSATGAALAFQVGAGAGGANQLTVAQNLKIDTTTTGGLFTVQLSSIDVTTNAGATSAIGLLDSAITDVSSARSTLGATQNRFEHIVANLSVAAENLTSSESRVRDTDMSLEMVSFTRDQIMMQAGTAMLAQANQVPQSVLQLLK
jgi:flagellin